MIMAVLVLMSVTKTDGMTVSAHDLLDDASSSALTIDSVEAHIANEEETVDFAPENVDDQAAETNGFDDEKIEKQDTEEFNVKDYSDTSEEPFIGPREATSDDFMESGPEYDPERPEPTNGFSPKESNIFEDAVLSSSSKKRQLYEYDPLKDYTCIINKKCPAGKTCITSSTGLEFVMTLSYDVPGNDLV